MAAKKTAKKAPAKKKAAAKKAPAKKKAAAKKTPSKKVVKKTAAKKKAAAKKAPAKKKKTTARKTAKVKYTAEQVYVMIQQAAYYAAENDGFSKDPSEYWSQAEVAINGMIKG